MRLTLDHVILRAADPAAALDELVARTGAPVLVPVRDAGPFTSGIVRASVDIELLKIGSTPPPHVLGYGLGFTVDVPLTQANKALRKAGFPTSGTTVATANGRTWAAVQVHGLLPDPFPLPVTKKAPKPSDRVAEQLAAWLTKIPAVGRMATRKPGSSMVVVTEYRFDADAWRATAGTGPTVVKVEVGARSPNWAKLPLEPGPLTVSTDLEPGVRRIVLEGAGTPFTLGDVEFAYAADPAEADARKLVAMAERMPRPLPDAVVAGLVRVLRFFPQAPDPEHWPQTWVRAARLLEPAQLDPVARGEQRAYLTALGALKLAQAGYSGPLIDRWLNEERDYPSLTEAERAALKRAG
ncbi:hypothetical protein DVA67_002275 [Solirubrobacter sp. CPCC 204708]|uniref:Uncharacterized protein n=1 Tax=Solirubrobacter deserti TaxID=2282478 RepID=A0ABT4RRP0_9ACTN|nr:hypothetical protein [Solirubrobacter deserti]MBE2314786.1 hypothetical protein [Solirubrobacter deserti]MDA0141196.1 hypothetical protein [Solirubrobacter deserti]